MDGSKWQMFSIGIMVKVGWISFQHRCCSYWWPSCVKLKLRASQVSSCVVCTEHLLIFVHYPSRYNTHGLYVWANEWKTLANITQRLQGQLTTDDFIKNNPSTSFLAYSLHLLNFHSNMQLRQISGLCLLLLVEYWFYHNGTRNEGGITQKPDTPDRLADFLCHTCENAASNDHQDCESVHWCIEEAKTQRGWNRNDVCNAKEVMCHRRLISSLMDYVYL